MRRPSFAAARWSFAMGLLDQGLQSTTTFTLTIVAARSVGAAGLGAVALGFAALLIPAGAQRALVVDPYITYRGSAQSDARAYGAAFTISLAGGLTFSLMFALGGFVTGGALRSGLLAFAPWVAPFLVQMLYRAAAFRHGRGATALAVSTASLATFGALLALGLRTSVATVVAAWGIGMTVGAVTAVCFSAASRTGIRTAWLWFRSDALPFGRWLAGATVVFTISTYMMLVLLSAILGPAAVGAYRAIESAFSPLSLVAAGLSNPGVRELRNAMVSRTEVRIASLLGAAAALVTGTYALLLSFWEDGLVQLLGNEFEPYLFLVAPIAVGQVILALPLGFSLLLKVRRRGRLYLPIGLLSPLATVLSAPLAAYYWGLEAAAWAVALSGVLSATWAIAAGVLVCRRDRVVAAPPALSRAGPVPRAQTK